MRDNRETNHDERFRAKDDIGSKDKNGALPSVQNEEPTEEDRQLMETINMLVERLQVLCR